MYKNTILASIIIKSIATIFHFSFILALFLDILFPLLPLSRRRPWPRPDPAEQSHGPGSRSAPSASGWPSVTGCTGPSPAPPALSAGIYFFGQKIRIKR
jgi:hypothetical protein